MKLSSDLLLKFKDQVLLVLADYRNMDKNTLELESTRIQIASRIVDNLVVLASRSMVVPARKRGRK